MTLQQEAPAEPVHVVPSRPTRGPNRTWRLLQVTHRWFSLITGIVLLLIILSGAILVLAPEIDEWTQPELYRSTPSERTLTPEQAVASLKRAEPDFVPGDVVRQRGIYEIYDLEYVKSAYVDPGTGRVNGIADRQSGVMGFLRNLHLCALSCEGYPAYIPFLAKPAPVLGNEELTVGGLILAVTGLILIFLCISGLVIWWPGLRRWKRGFKVRRGKGAYKLNYDLHNVVGIAVLPLLLMWAITGAGFELKQIRDAWYAVLPGEKPPEFEDPVSKPGDGRIGIDEAERIALAKVPDARAVSVSVPDQASRGLGVLRVRGPRLRSLRPRHLAGQRGDRGRSLQRPCRGHLRQPRGRDRARLGGLAVPVPRRLLHGLGLPHELVRVRVPAARPGRHRRHDVVDAAPQAQAQAQPA